MTIQCCALVNTQLMEYEESLRVTAKKVLVGNIVSIKTMVNGEFKAREYLLAGREQHRYLLVRSACYSARALALAGYSEVIENLAELYFERLSDAETPIVAFDEYSPEWRSIKATLRRYMGDDCISNDIPGHLIPFYGIDQETFDIHLLVLLSLTYIRKSKCSRIIAKHVYKIRMIMTWYTSHVIGGMLIHSGATSGDTFLVNLLLHEVQLRLTNTNPGLIANVIPIQDLKARLRGAISAHDDITGNLLVVLWSLTNSDKNILTSSEAAAHFSVVDEPQQLTWLKCLYKEIEWRLYGVNKKGIIILGGGGGVPEDYVPVKTCTHKSEPRSSLGASALYVFIKTKYVQGVDNTGLLLWL